MDFFEELRKQATERKVNPFVVGEVIDRLQKSVVGNRLNFLAAVNNHGPPLVDYAADVIQYRIDLASGKDTGKEIMQKMEEMAVRGFGEDLLTDLNREIRGATAPPRDGRDKRHH
jgi:hypothetical protein